MKQFLHRQIWQRLPQTLRRSALFGVTKALSPRKATHATPALPIIIVGALRSASGLGQSARLCHDALKTAGLPVFGIDVSKDLMQAVDFPDFSFEDGRNCMGAGTLIVHVNAPLIPLALLRLGRTLVRQKHIVGYWAWELPKVPLDWRIGVDFVHEIWVPSQFTAKALAPIIGDLPIQVFPHPVATHMPSSGASRPNSATKSTQPFTVLSIFNAASSLARKNPMASILAFQKAFGDDETAHLILKTSNSAAASAQMDALSSHCDNAGNITLIKDVLDASEMDALYDKSHVLLSLHRAEGFGLTLAEAMLRGLPCVATNWSGNVDFLTKTTGFPVPFQLIAAQDPQYTYDMPDTSWADADVPTAAEILQHLRAQPSEARKVGLAAQQFAQKTWSSQSYARQALLALNLQASNTRENS